MSLNDKSGFGIDLNKKFEGLLNTANEVQSTPTTTPTPEYTRKHTTNRKVKERKTERLQLTVRPSTKARLAQYAEEHDTSSNEVVQRLLDDLLDKAGY